MSKEDTAEMKKGLRKADPEEFREHFHKMMREFDEKMMPQKETMKERKKERKDQPRRERRRSSKSRMF